MSLIIIDGEGNDFIFDSVLTESRERSIQVTSQPIEDGSQISDHAQAMPWTYAAELVVTESPFDRGGGIEAIDDALAYLTSIEGQPVTLVSPRFGALRRMIVTAYPHRAGATRRLDVSLRATEVRMATSGTVRIPATQPVVAHRSSAPDEVDAGQQTASTAVTGPSQSVLYGLATSLGVL